MEASKDPACIENSLTAVQRDSEIQVSLLENMKFVSLSDPIIGNFVSQFVQSRSKHVPRAHGKILKFLEIQDEDKNAPVKFKEVELFDEFTQDKHQKETLAKWVKLLADGCGIHFAKEVEGETGDNTGIDLNNQFVDITGFLCWTLIRTLTKNALKFKFKGFRCLRKHSKELIHNELVDRYIAGPLLLSHFHSSSALMLYHCRPLI